MCFNACNFQQLLNRNQEITPTAAEQASIQNLVTKVSQILEKIVVTPDSFTPVVTPTIKMVIKKLNMF